jgi:hypothetical protein
MHNRNATSLSVVVILVAVLAACTSAATTPGAGDASAVQSAPAAAAGSPAAGGGAMKPDPCTLLTPADLEAAFGTGFQLGVLVGTPTAPSVSCQWPKQGGFVAWLTLTIDDIGAAGFGCIGDPVPGVGDEACLGLGGLHVRHGAWDFVFSAGSEDITEQQLIDVAKLAVSRL